MEVLISVGILSIGLLGVAALIPVGKMAMIETEKSDRTGACGRAALQEVRVRGLYDPSLWNGVAATDRPKVVILDPLGWNNTTLKSLPFGGTSGALTRYTLTTATSSSAATQTLLAESLCRWPDDLSFARPDEVTATGTTSIGSRPVPVAFDTDGNPEAQGNFSWFLTIAPQYFSVNGQNLYSGMFNVAAVVCYKRTLSTDGEKVATVPSTAPVPSIANGGGDVTLSGKYDIQNNQWVMLCKADGSAVAWCRVVNQFYDDEKGWTTLMLVGSDWNGAADDRVIIIDGVTGVYTTTVRAN